MPRLLKNNEFYQDSTVIVTAETDLNSAQETFADKTVLIPVKLWLADSEPYKALSQSMGLLFEADDMPESVEGDLSFFELIAVDFPGFMDGRGYSTARELRDHYKFEGDIRATGDVLIDQLFAMKRCGFSSFLLREDQKQEDALKALDTFTLRYQGSSDDHQPLYRKRG
ncbi:oxidoreductase [Endozoicomonas sp. OPT23]|uniref:DUF934 domain-containing protein n=1 Tax=Endozoicomonas sp. OPT23 TaxID=2072845 RepID=UPI00129B3559|nr:DUF934 domain-containing protein [Endozoicomonas sp. OPT23]MRI34161.1 oxidoreductase [Endozoicomonas sp. OPT23]